MVLDNATINHNRACLTEQGISCRLHYSPRHHYWTLSPTDNAQDLGVSDDNKEHGNMRREQRDQRKKCNAFVHQIQGDYNDISGWFKTLVTEVLDVTLLKFNVDLQ